MKRGQPCLTLLGCGLSGKCQINGKIEKYFEKYAAMLDNIALFVL